MAVQAYQQVDDIATTVTLFRAGQGAQLLQPEVEVRFQALRAVEMGQQPVKHRLNDEPCLAGANVVPGLTLVQRVSEQQRQLAFTKLFTHTCDQSLGHIRQDDRLQGKDRPMLCSFYQATAAQGVHRLHHLTFGDGMAQIGSEGLQRDRLAGNGQPVHQRLLQRRQPFKLLA